MDLFTKALKAKRVIEVFGCGGVGTATALKVAERLTGVAGSNFSFVDTERPAGVSSTSFVELRPDFLPDEPDERLAAILADTGIAPERYRQWKLLSGAAGVSRLPFLAYLGALYCLADLTRTLEGDFRRLSTEVGGASSTWLLTMSSGLGGTGAPSARAVGLAFRQAIDGVAPDARWLHVVVTSSLLPDAMLTRRTRALEHRSLVELAALMSPAARLSLPGRRAPVEKPGPDFIWLLGASAEAPRSLDEALDETASLLRNLLTA